MILIKFYYHMLCAYVLNLRAAHHAKAMRAGKDGAGKKLLDVGRRSNEHERLREIYRAKVWEWFDR